MQNFGVDTNLRVEKGIGIGMQQNKIILFGAGICGYEVFKFLGESNILCFCDNDERLIGEERYGKQVISFDDLKNSHKEDVIIICVINSKAAYDIAKQCEEGHISDYLFYKDIKGKFSDGGHLLDYIKNPINRAYIRQKVYINRINELSRQVDYLKGHTDIRRMKPAQGKLRARQLELVKGSAEFFTRIDSLEIKPILYGGNLLGHVRHNGFIPWDDDIDFALIRKEYETLKEYCRQHIYTVYEFNNKSIISGEKEVADDMKDYYWRDGADLFTVYKPINNGDRIRIDFFVLDYYAEDYSVNELLEYSKEVNKKIVEDSDIGKRIEYFEEVRRENKHHTVSNSNNVYFGIDNTEIRHKFHRGQWIPKDVVFPLKRVLFEGEYFWVPNDSEEFVQYEYENIWSFPDNVGIFEHMNMDYRM